MNVDLSDQEFGTRSHLKVLTDRLHCSDKLPNWVTAAGGFTPTETARLYHDILAQEITDALTDRNSGRPNSQKYVAEQIFFFEYRDGKLSPHFRCIALDYPGFGLSTAKLGYGFLPREHSTILERFVDHLGLADLRIMVQDWGGPIGLGFAGRRPELIHSVVLGNTFAWPAQRSKGMAAFSKVVGSGLARFLITRYNTLDGALSEPSRLPSSQGETLYSGERTR